MKLSKRLDCHERVSSYRNWLGCEVFKPFLESNKFGEMKKELEKKIFLFFTLSTRGGKLLVFGCVRRVTSSFLRFDGRIISLQLLLLLAFKLGIVVFRDECSCSSVESALCKVLLIFQSFYFFFSGFCSFRFLFSQRCSSVMGDGSRRGRA